MESNPTYDENPGMYAKNDKFVVDNSPILPDGYTCAAPNDQATGKATITKNSESNPIPPNEND
jgi:hypothetical protein